MFCLENSLQAKHHCIHCLRRNGVNTSGNGSSVKKIINSMRPGNKPSMPRSNKPIFLQPEEHTNETYAQQIREEMDINANETETLQTGKERHSNGQSDLMRYNITKLKRTLQQALDRVPSGLQKGNGTVPSDYLKQVPEILLTGLTIKNRGSIEQEVSRNSMLHGN
ncbi:hypothetical protein Cgig2_003571 [Carnegiea gigantea]|uniref:Uncharacterized protein n=1 Tax=Carnegiea gigantea TaxID=171969 RepID=A0A9Q1Q8M1_9CARY|nr:hypothetical protein Cgig2_003571 [Carnegiea gigantea]